MLPKGFKDFDVEEAILFKKIRNIIEESYESFGFFPVITPIIEYYDILAGKYNEEAEQKEMWVFEFHNKKYALKYDQTVPLVRFVSMSNPKLPFKRYTIDRSFRHENPQKGRYREFWQADADIIGSKYEEADAEIINLMIFTMKRLGFKDFKIKISDRHSLEKILSKYGDFIKLARIIDKWDKIGEEGVRKELEKLVGDKANKIIEELENKDYDERFWKIIDLVEDKKYLDIDMKLARGFDYYTGMIFEIWSKFPRALGGGGRYDNLFKLFSKDLPAVGGSIGINAIIDAGLESGIYKLEKKLDLGIIYINEFEKAWRLANALRKVGIKVYIDLMRRNFKKQIEYLLELNVNFIIIIGEKDLREGKITLQNRKTKERIKLNYKEVLENPNIIKEYLNSF